MMESALGTARVLTRSLGGGIYKRSISYDEHNIHVLARKRKGVMKIFTEIRA